MLHRAARNAYSWWWASHIRTKQSKWLEENLQDMEEKVEYILKIINEDGDSFAVRAEMYYRKRPELVNFVEDCFRGYRALAERYDHLSRDLQSANRTIASVFPERVQLSMDEEEEESFAATSALVRETNFGPPTALPAVPKVSIPKIQNFPKKKSKMPSRLMSKKGLVKIGGDDDIVVTKSSGLSKTEALEEIDNLQKGILALQTEKEFIKSSYENGVAKFWEIENRVTEMQAQVSNLQDEFGIGTVIEDDEARTLMTATAIKSCQETLAKLQEKQTQTEEEARIEYQRIHEAQEKFEILKERHLSSPTYKQGISGETKFESRSPQLKKSTEQAESFKQQYTKDKEQFLLGTAPVTISELAEKIDEIVDKVINLETEVSSQISLVQRLKSETNDLHSHLRILEGDKEMLTEGSDSKNNKIRELEEELRRVQNLNQNVEDQNQSLQTCFQEASSNVDQLSGDLLNVKPDEEVQDNDFLEEAGSVPGETLFHEKTADSKKNEGILNRRDFSKAKNKHARSRHRDFFDVVVEVGQLKVASKENTQRGFKGNQEILSIGFDVNSMISKDARIEEEAMKDGILDQNCSVKAEEDDFVKPCESAHRENLFSKSLVKNVSKDSPEKDFESMMSKEMHVDEERRLVYFSDQHPAKAQDGKSFLQSSPLNHLDNFPSQIQMKPLGCASNSMISNEKKDGFLDRDCSVKAEDSTVTPFQTTRYEDVLEAGLMKDDSKDNPEKVIKENEDMTLKEMKVSKKSSIDDFSDRGSRAQEGENFVPSNYFSHPDNHSLRRQVRSLGCASDSMMAKDTMMEEEARDDGIVGDNHYVKAEEENIVKPYQGIHHEDFMKKGLMKDVSEDHPEKVFKKLEDKVALGCQSNSMISEDGSKEEEPKKDDVLSLKDSLNSEEENTVEPKRRVQNEDLSKKGLAEHVSENMLEKESKRPEDDMALGCDLNSVISREERMEAERKKDDALRCNPFLNVEEANIVDPYQSIQQENILKGGQVKDVSQDNPVKGFKENEDMMLKEMNMEEERSVDYFLRQHPAQAHEGERYVQSSQLHHFDNMPVKSQMRPPVDGNLEKGLNANVNIAAPQTGSIISIHGQSSSSNAVPESLYVCHPSNPFDDHYGVMGLTNDRIIGEQKEYYFPDFIPTKAETSSQLDYPSENVHVDWRPDKSQEVKKSENDENLEFSRKLNKDAEELDTDEEEPNWRHLFMYGLEDREKMLLEEYTATLRNYKEVKKKLNEAEKKNRASLFKTTVQIKVLRNSNASKDAEIQSLHQKLNLFQTNIDETPNYSNEQRAESLEKAGEEEGEIKQTSIDEAQVVSNIEEKIRMDIDDLLEENIDFWLRFSTSLHQVQKFQTSFHDLQRELKELKEKKQDGNTKQDQSNVRPIYKHLRDILTELTLWWDNNGILEDDLLHRLMALSNIQEEISKLSNAGAKEEGTELSEYQAAKFQGEIQNMKQENNKVAEELRTGADRVRRLQVDIEKTLAKLDEELGKNHQKSSSSRSRIPLRSFLFGVKLRKQKPSFFACMSPALQKQYSDLSALPP